MLGGSGTTPTDTPPPAQGSLKITIMKMSSTVMTREAVKRAWDARKWHNALQHPPDNNFKNLLNRGTFAGVNARDWDNATEWFGRCRACLAGKICEDPARASTLTQAPGNPGEELSVDLFFCGKLVILFATCRLTRYRTAVLIGTKHADSIGNGMLLLINRFNQFSRRVNRIRTDGETGVEAGSTVAEMSRRGVQLLKERGHAAEAERSIYAPHEMA